jgi:hypothetical protein
MKTLNIISLFCLGLLGICSCKHSSEHSAVRTVKRFIDFAEKGDGKFFISCPIEKSGLDKLVSKRLLKQYYLLEQNANNARVSAMESFKSKYGEYPEKDPTMITMFFRNNDYILGLKNWGYIQGTAGFRDDLSNGLRVSALFYQCLGKDYYCSRGLFYLVLESDRWVIDDIIWISAPALDDDGQERSHYQQIEKQSQFLKSLAKE